MIDEVEGGIKNVISHEAGEERRKVSNYWRMKEMKSISAEKKEMGKKERKKEEDKKQEMGRVAAKGYDKASILGITHH